MERSDLPEGQQPKGPAVAIDCLIAGMESRRISPVEDSPRGYVRGVLDHVDRLVEQRDGAYAHLPTDADWERHDAEIEARVRADVAEDLARLVESLCPAGGSDHEFCDYRVCATAIREWAVAPAESVVGAPTPIAAVSDLAAPRDALTDQDFADLRTDAASARGAGQYDWAIRLEPGKAGEWVLPRDDEAHARRFIAEYASDTSDAVLVRRWVGDWGDVPVGALPVDEGTRRLCRRCGNPRAACASCGEPAQCGDLLCAACTPADDDVSADEGTRQEGLINVEE